MIIYIVESEAAYLDLIADLSRYGVHSPNQFAQLDRDGLAIADRFETLPPYIAEENLGVRDYEYEMRTVVDDKGKEWEEEPCCGTGPLNRKTLHICPELVKYMDFPPPTQEDYPILIMWRWEDDWDRMGPIKTRYFDWVSLSKIERVKAGRRTPVAKTYRKWKARYGKKYEEICQQIKRDNEERFER